MESLFKKWANTLGGWAVLGLCFSLVWGFWDYQNTVPWSISGTLVVFIGLCLYILKDDLENGNSNKD